MEGFAYIQGWCDGGSRWEQNKSAFGWLIKAWREDECPIVLAAGAKFFDQAATSSFEIEAKGMLDVWTALRLIVAGNGQQLELGSRANNLSRKRRKQWLDGLFFRKSGWSHV